MLNKKSRYSGFTLIEMLIVMSILVLLTALSFAAYQNLQTTIRLNEFVNGFEQNVRKIQRDAMLLEKKPGDSWIYGLGFQIGTMDDSSTLGQYTPFKWCSGEADFGSAKTRGEVPNFDGDTNRGKIPIYLNLEGPCGNSNQLNKYPLFGEKNISTTGTKMPQVTISISSVLGEPSDKGVSFVLFESVTGRAFFYNSAGLLLNFDYNDVPPSILFDSDNKLMPLVIKVIPIRGGSGKKITISQTSGKIVVEGL